MFGIFKAIMESVYALSSYILCVAVLGDGTSNHSSHHASLSSSEGLAIPLDPVFEKALQEITLPVSPRGDAHESEHLPLIKSRDSETILVHSSVKKPAHPPKKEPLPSPPKLPLFHEEMSDKEQLPPNKLSHPSVKQVIHHPAHKLVHHPGQGGLVSGHGHGYFPHHVMVSGYRHGKVPHYKKVAAARPLQATGGCSHGWLPYGGSCYLFSRDRLSWWHALMKCSYMGGYLAVANTAHENSYLKVMCKKYNLSPGAWFGLNNVLFPKSHAWFWGYGKKACKWFDWYGEGPNVNKGHSNCGCFWEEYHYKWEIKSCRKQMFYICELNPNKPCTCGYYTLLRQIWKQ